MLCGGVRRLDFIVSVTGSHWKALSRAHKQGTPEGLGTGMPGGLYLGCNSAD